MPEAPGHLIDKCFEVRVIVVQKKALTIFANVHLLYLCKLDSVLTACKSHLNLPAVSERKEDPTMTLSVSFGP